MLGLQKHLKVLTAAGYRRAIFALAILMPVVANAHPGHDHAHSHVLLLVWMLFGIVFVIGFVLKLRSLYQKRVYEFESAVESGAQTTFNH